MAMTHEMRAQMKESVKGTQTELRDLHCLMQAVTENSQLPDSVTDYLWQLMNEKEEYLYERLRDDWLTIFQGGI